MEVAVLLVFSLVRSVVTKEFCDYTSYEENNGALLLTQYIEEGRFHEGREAARVPPLLGTIQSYAGFFTVNKEYHSNLFFWYFPAEEPPRERDSAPVILWLNGGPAETSLYGLMFENGPISLNDDLTLSRRLIYWSRHYHMIYIDNPVGVGFSFSQKNGLLSNETQIAKEMHSALVQFYQLFPDLIKNDFFVAGESYAGRYVPSIAYEIHERNQYSKIKIKLKGVIVGSGMVDYEYLYKKGVFLYELGLIDRRSLNQILKMEAKLIKAIKSHDFKTASELSYQLFKSEIIEGVSPYNFLEQDDGLGGSLSRINSFFNESHIRNHIHVGKVEFCGLAVEIFWDIWNGDGFMEVSPYVEVLLEHYRVLYYNGQLAIHLPYVACEEYTEKLRWSGASNYRQAPRKPWVVGGKLAGFSRSGGNLSLVLVRNAGHMVAMDQPEWALDVITKFVNNKEIG